MTSFIQLGLSEPVLKALSTMGFSQPTDIQKQAIPNLLSENRDFIGLAQTGTGKTAAFGLPLLEKIDPSLSYTQGLILAPTRELGQQIAGQLELFGKFLPKINVLPVYGGASIVQQMRALKTPRHIIIATPGRLADLIARKAVHLDKLRFLVLDEADEMLNMGFKEELDHILSFIPAEKNTWLFSATMPEEIRRIIRQYMTNPFEVRVNKTETVNANIEHKYVVVKPADKTAALMRFLDHTPDMRGIVFCRTRKDAQDLATDLFGKGYRADALHGDLSQVQRDKVMGHFKAHRLQILVATDVAARGIDVQDLTHIFHFSLPDDISYYTHRSGRTARAGKTGISLVFAGGRDRIAIQRLEKQLGITFTRTDIPSGTDIVMQRMEQWFQTILTRKPRGKVSVELLERAEILFGGLSKEELLAKLLLLEMEKMNLSGMQDLNEEFFEPFRKERKDPRSFREKRPYGKFEKPARKKFVRR